MPQIAATAATMLTGGIDFWLDDRRRRRLLLLVQLLKGMLELNQTCRYSGRLQHRLLMGFHLALLGFFFTHPACEALELRSHATHLT